MFCFKVVLACALLVISTAEHKDGGVAPRIPLNDGNSIPAMGFGTFLGFDESGLKKVEDGEVEVPVLQALEAGYRLIDSAQGYDNEEQVGSAIRKSSVPRENIFVVTKLATTNQRTVVDSLKTSLNKLNLTYVDLYLIHFPIAFKPDHSGYDVVDYVDTWKAMEAAKKQGLAKSIGISNFNISQIERLLANCEMTPAVLQVEVNLNLAQTKLREYCQKNDIVVMAYTPFGSLFDKSGAPPPPRADDPTLVEMARKYNKTTPQIALRYLIQLGVVPIPKSVHLERIEQNIKVFDFELTSQDMEVIGKFNKDYRVVFPSFWQDHPYYPFELTNKPHANPFKPKQ